MKNISRTIELIANVAIILVVILLGIVLVKTHVFTTSPNIQSLASANQSSGHPKIGLPDVDWSKSDKTLVLAISSTCHFCTESAPFYRQLSGAHEGIQLIAVLPQPVYEGRRYVKELGFEVDDVVQAPLNSIGVSGTPTLLVINRDGNVTGTWVGRLALDQEAKVLAHLKAGSGIERRSN